MDTKEKESNERHKLVSLAFLAGSLSIISTLLQLDKAVFDNYPDIKTANSIFAVLLPILIIDIYFLHDEKIDGINEHKIYKFIRLMTWLGCLYAFFCVAGKLPGQTYTTGSLMAGSFFVFLVIRLIPDIFEEFKKILKEKNPPPNSEKETENNALPPTAPKA